MAYAFDTLAYARRLRDGGVPLEVAEVHADAAREFIMTELATRSDLDLVRRDLDTARRELETSLTNHVARLETLIATQVSRLETLIATVRRELKADMRDLENRMTIKMGFMFATAIAILAAIIKL